MHRVQRKDLLLEYLCQKPFHEMNHVLEYVAKFDISATTARRDLKELENESIITMFYGGINFLGVHNKSCSIDVRASSINFDKKMIIAKKLLNLLEKNDIIFVGVGSTCEVFVTLIDKPVKIVTNSFRILQLAKDNYNVQYNVLIGGKVREKSQAFYGSLCEESLSLIQFSKVIFSANTIDQTGAVYKSNEEEARVELAALARVQTKILLADSTKFDKLGFFKFYETKNVSYLVTDKPEVAKQYDLNVSII
ncbi:MAG: DeoR/GlpR transcriptional regulator [Spiroplasma poulsonii]|uniref:Lactose phosphotransferase system repressor n=1 Tax=Spiroplasma poulsonii TaxID=2138 RepID=A0A2P6FCM8_9MOLU|nr:DeoR/GlpR family DNA-binding transcription regulator [Spiroplasma poulsonii]KAF0851598.1 Lactose phosphotransferase system repressor [Spiroplasma poulsonii]MBW1242162.1 DeoR/GlpR transcriptional regulator [Spiroplasma poulsonii]PQM31196.1 Lactose phosphotransferase system repressor [Spiroplasma poulsonii]PWF96195.1 Lactose phosphotransferase system repressor [Spiroplasma poulsonii]PWF98970.1 Lactose phosphotransferase system repressor [Spiroplasma poulsonii]